MNWQGKRVVVIGAGLSGRAAVRKLQKLGTDVYLTDQQVQENLSGIEELGLPQDHLLLGGMPEFQAIQPQEIVISPGISPRMKLIEEARKAGVEVWSEVELAMRDCPAKVIGITGTNGKTTTTSLIGELVKLTGRPVVVAGNIGAALSDSVKDMTDDGIVVAELSSFQLELTNRVRFHVAILLNITPDHLDRHDCLENYTAAKARIFENQEKNDLAILNWDDPAIRHFGDQVHGRFVYFSPTSVLENGIGFDGENILYGFSGKQVKIIAYKEMQLRGAHNLENVMASVAAAYEMGLSWEQIAEGLRQFRGVEHRQEIVGKWEDILYVNDSKGTNPDAAIKALQAFDEPLVLIAGGKNKGLDFHEFMRVAKERVKTLVLLGMAAEDMEKAAREVGITRILRADSFPDGVNKAITEAKPGDVVLLSPACTSWDMFKSYEKRGELFKELVRTHYRKP